jgi:Ca2+-binding RTX toxin-like protein
MATTYSVVPGPAASNEDPGTLTFTITRSGDLLAETLFVSAITTETFTDSSDDSRWLNQAQALSQTVTVSNINAWPIGANNTFELLVQRNATDVLSTFLTSSTFIIPNSDTPATADNLRVSSASSNDSLGTAITSTTAIAFVDRGVTNFAGLIAALDPSLEVVILDATRDGVDQITDFLSDRRGISSIHIISHGAAGSLELGVAELSSATLATYASQLARIGSALSANGDILLYGCDVASGPTGQAFVEQLAKLTDADVAASNDLTGATSLGADADLEIHVGDVTENVLLDQTTLDNLGLVLGTLPTTVTPGSGIWIWASPFGDVSKSANIGTGTEIDFYRFMADQTGNYVISVSGGSLDSQLRVYDSSGTAITGVIDSSFAGGTESVTLNRPTGTWFYIAITGFQTGTGTYTLSVNGPDPAPQPSISTLGPTYASSSNGNVDYGGDLDYFTITAPSGTSTLNLTVTPGSGLDTYVELYNSSGALLQTIRTGGTGSADFASNISITAGATYYIGVSSESSSATGAYAVNVDFNPDQVQDFGDPPANITPSTGPKWIWANPFGDVNSTDRGSTNLSPISTSTEIDYYRLIPDFGGSYVISVSGPVDSQLRAYDQNGNAVTGIINSSGAGGTESATLSLSPGQWYYIAVAGAGTSTGSYTLSVNGPTLVAESISTPAPTYASSVSRQIDYGGDLDYFSFTAPSGTSTLNLTVTPTSGLDTYVELFNSAGTLLQTIGNGVSGSFGVADTASNISVSAGSIYYVGVSSWSSTNTGTYSVNVDFNPDQSTTKPDLTAVLTSAPPASATAGSAFSISYAIANGGDAAASNFLATYYISTDQIFGNGNDNPLDPILSFPGLASGATTVGTTTLTIPGILGSGTYYVALIADKGGGFANGQIDESSETNNVSNTFAINVIAPLPIATLSPAGVNATEGGQPLIYNVNLDRITAQDITVFFQLGGSATTADYQVKSGTQTLFGSVVVPAGSSFASISIYPTPDSLTNEGDETVTIQLTGISANAQLGSTLMAAGTIHDGPPVILKTGQALVDEALQHLGQEYVWGVTPGQTAYANSNYAGPWDCSEFVSWAVDEVYAEQIGLRSWNAYTGYWADDAALGSQLHYISLTDARNTPGAIIFRFDDTIHHIAISEGNGKLVEANVNYHGGFYWSDDGTPRAPVNGDPPAGVDIGDVGERAFDPNIYSAVNGWNAVVINEVVYTTSPVVLPPSETDDYHDASPSTLGRLTIGGPATLGKIETAGDKDWFKIDNLVVGHGYKVVVAADGADPLNNTFFSVRDSTSQRITGDANRQGGQSYDDAFGNTNAAVEFTATSTGAHYVVVGGGGVNAASENGGYSVSIVEVSEPINSWLGTGTAIVLNGASTRGYIGFGNDPADYYTFTPTQSGTVTVNLTGLGADIDALVVNSAGQRIDTLVLSSAAAEQRTAYVTPDQTYHIEVAPHSPGSASQQSPYAIDLDFTASGGGGTVAETAEVLFGANGKLATLTDFALAAYDNNNDGQAMLPSGWQVLGPTDLGMSPSYFSGQYYDPNFFSNLFQTNAEAVVARSADSLVLSFRGTELASIVDWYDDLLLPLGRLALADYYSKFDSLIAAIDNYIKLPANEIEHLYVVGHSLGAAMVDAYFDEHEIGDAKYNDIRALNSSLTYEGLTIADPGYVVTGNGWNVTNFWNEDDPINFVPLNAPGDDNTIYFGDTLDIDTLADLVLHVPQHSAELYKAVIDFISNEAGPAHIEALIKSCDNIVVPRTTAANEGVALDTLGLFGGYFYQGSGADTLKGGVGNDLLFAGAGDDTYEFSSILPWGHDTIIDSGGEDVIDIGDSNGNLSVHSEDRDLVISFTPSLLSPGILSGGTLRIDDYYNPDGQHKIETLRWNDTNYELATIVAEGEKRFDPALDTVVATVETVVAAGKATLNAAGSAAGGFYANLKDGIGIVTDPIWNWFGGSTPAEATPGGEDSLIGKTVTLSGFTNVIGTQYNDKIIGNDDANELQGGSGNDLILGGAGNDTMLGGAGNDTLIGGANGATAASVALQSGPEGQDLWITDVFSYDDNFGVDDGFLKVGGWGDNYNSLLRFDLSTMPTHATSATLRLYNTAYSDYAPTGVLVDELHTTWDENYGWHDYALNATNIGSVGTPALGWIDIDLTSAVNDWLLNPSSNFGIQLRPADNWHTMDYFVSSDAIDAMAQFRPELVIQFPGGTDNDWLDGGPGADVLNGGAGVDRASYSTSTVGLTANVLNPLQNTGDAFGDSYVGIEGLQGSNFNDTLIGDFGNNFLIGGPGADVLNGGAGNDIADYRTATQGLTVDLATPANNTGDATGDTFISIERLRGSNFDDSLYGNGGSNTLDGGAGADHLDGGGGFDYARYQSATTGVIASLLNPASNTGDAAGDSYIWIEGLWGSDFADTLIGDANGNYLDGGAGGDLLEGGGGFDYARYQSATTGVIASLLNPASNTGDAAGDSYILIEGLDGSNFADTLIGDANLNILTGNQGTDILNGQGNFDYAAYWNSSVGLAVSLANPASNTGEAAGDSFFSIEGLIGSNLADTLVGDGNHNWLVGGPGADALDGQGGIDYAAYWTAATGLIASLANPASNTGDAAGDTYSSIEGLVGSGFNDTLIGNSDDNTLAGGPGGDVLIGGSGFDYANYDINGPNGVTASLLNPASNTGDAAGDSYSSIEGLIGTAFADSLTGDGNENDLQGHGGGDRLDGQGANDSLTGGNGADTFVYANGYGADIVTDFSHGEADKIDLTGINNVLDLGDVLARASGTSNTVIDFDAGNILTLNGVAPGSLTASDFVFATDLPPTAVSLSNATASIAENSSTATHIKVADIVVTDDALGSNSLALTGTDAASFEIVGGALYLKAGTVLDYETKSSYAVAVTVDDPTVGGSPDAISTTYSLNVTNVNEAPTAVSLSNATASIAENSSTATHIKVADIVITDDALGSNSLALTGTDAASFEIVGGALYLKVGTVLDYETKSSYAVAVTVDDPTVGAAPDAISTTYTLNVINVLGVTITGTSGKDTIDATHTVAGQSLPTNEEDTIRAGVGNDTINALGGNDFIDGGAGNDTMIGGTGNDTFVVDANGDVVVENPNEGTDTVQSSITYILGANVENLNLTSSANLNGTGNALNNIITGNDGNNVLAGLGGADSLEGGLGADTASYAASPSGVTVSLVTATGSGGDAQDDTLVNIENLTGSNFNDTLEGNGGNNVLVGGAGTDTLSYEHATAGVTVSLAVTAAQNTGSAGSDTVSGFENLFGSAFDDLLTGSSAANVINGLGGNDVLIGGGGADTLTGGAGADRFVFAAPTDSSPATSDVVADFVHGTDKIDLSAIDANSKVKNDQAFVFVAGQNPNTVANSVTWTESNGSTIIHADVNGDSSPELTIRLSGINLQINANDFIL